MKTKPSSLLKTIETLAQTPRQPGTANEKKAAAFFLDAARRCGLKARKEPFPVIVSTGGRAEICVDGKTFSGFPFGLCADSDFEAELIFTENPRAVNRNPEFHRGKILLTYGRPRELYSELRDTGIAGMISFGPPHKTALSLSHRQYDSNPLPAMTLDYDSAAELRAYDGKKVRMKLRHKVKETQGINVVVEAPGTHPDGIEVYFVGHYDSVEHSPGACDNAGGCAILTALMEHFQKPHRRNCKLIFFSGEELGLVGSQFYCFCHEKEIAKSCRMVFNIDVAGDELGTNELYVTGTRELIGLTQGATLSAGTFCNARLSLYSSDSIPFARLGIPSVNIARYGGKGSYQGHTTEDKACFAGEYGLQQTLQATLAAADPFVNGIIYPAEVRIDDSLRDELEKYIYGLTGIAPELAWQPKYKI